MDYNKLKRILLKEIILSKTVFIIGHKNLDMDAFASIMGLSLLCKKFKKQHYIVTDDKTFDYGIKNSIDKLKLTNIINSSKAKTLINNKSLLIILDTNKKNLICFDNIDIFKKIIIIDHHDKDENTIKTTDLYINKTVSSASEIITMLLRNYKVKTTNLVNTLLLSGIILDTNGLSYKMNKKTFYNCYYLLSQGANMNESQELLKEDYNDYLNNQKLISNAIINEDIAIAKGQKNKIYTRKTLAITADTLLTFRKVKFSLVIGKINEKEIGVSVRSIGKINANKVMNIFEGGGNQSEAAAIVTNKTPEEIEKEILEFIKR